MRSIKTTAGNPCAPSALSVRRFGITVDLAHH